MTTKITLDHLQKKADDKFGGLEIEYADGKSVTLLNLLRMEKKDRKALRSLYAEQEEKEKAIKARQESGEDSDIDEDEYEDEQILFYQEFLTLIASDKTAVAEFLEAVGNDLVMLSTVATEYGTGTELGEASPSND